MGEINLDDFLIEESDTCYLLSHIQYFLYLSAINILVSSANRIHFPRLDYLWISFM